MTRYIMEPVRADRAAIRAEIVDKFTDLQPGVEVEPGTLWDFLIDPFASASAEDRELMTEVLAGIFRYSGEKINRVPQRQAVAATVQSTWERTSVDELAIGARLVPQGTEVNVRGPDGLPVAFRTVSDFTFPDGVTATASGAVPLVAVTAGTDGNGLTGTATSAQTQPWFQAVTLVGTTGGGVDAETDDDFLDRLADTGPLQSQAIKNAADLTRWLRNQPGVYRAMALDNYNAPTNTPGAPGHLTGIPIGPDGAALSSPVMAALELAARQVTLTNLLTHITGPADNDVTIVVEGIAEAGYDRQDVETRTADAVTDLLSRLTWGAPQSGDRRPWTEKLVLRFQDVSTAVNNVPGFDHHDVLTINGVAADLTFDGPGALPEATPTITVEVTLP